MSHPIFYLPPGQWHDQVTLEGQEAHHLARVLRIPVGTQVTLLNGQGRTGTFTVCRIQKSTVHLTCVAETTTAAPRARAVMALASSKAVRRGFFMEKAVELGAHAVWLWQADRSQGTLSPAAEEACRRQMIAGAKQCGNPWLPDVAVLPQGVEELTERAAQAQYRILPWEGQVASCLLSPRLVGQEGLTVYVIGPEGGFSDRERVALQKADFTAVSLGARVLRCETAAVICLGLHWWVSQQPGKPDAAEEDR